MDSVGYEVREVVSGQAFRCLPGQSLLRAMEAQGKHCVPVGCRGGGCGLCKVRVLSGDYRRGRMSGCHVPPEAAARGLALACQVFPCSDLTIETLRREREGQPNNKNHQEVSS
ncbi:2Fe-2S iron-sulfur cluster binding domain protein [compost metagenome]